MSVINLGVPVTLRTDFNDHLRSIIDPKITPDPERLTPEDFRSAYINKLSLRGESDGNNRLKFLESLVPVIDNENRDKIQSFTGTYKSRLLTFVMDAKLGGGSFGNVYRYVHEPTAERGLPRAAFAVKMFDKYLYVRGREAREREFESCRDTAEREAAIVETLEEAGAFEESTAARVIRLGSVPPMIAMELTEGSLVNWTGVKQKYWTFSDAAATVYAMFRECENVYYKTSDKEYTKPLLYADFKPDNFLYTRASTNGELHVIMGDYGSLAPENARSAGPTFVKPLPDATAEDAGRSENLNKRLRVWKNTWDNLAFCMGISILTFLKLDKNQAKTHFNIMTQDEIDAHMKNIFESELTEKPERKLIAHLLNYKDPNKFRVFKSDSRWPGREINVEDIRKEFYTYNVIFKSL